MTDEGPDSAVIITGAAGGVGQGLAKCFADAGYGVIAIDCVEAPASLPCRHYVRADLQRTVEDPDYASAIFLQIRTSLGGQPLKALINNAAVQILGSVEGLSRDDWRATLDVNLLAPFFWAQALLPELEAAKGSVLNISSIHARLTKSSFIAYATSKAALSGLTRSMAVELGSRVRVNAIELAAVDTKMLRDGFAGNDEKLDDLAKCHPQNRIAEPSEIGNLAVWLASDQCRFLHGSCVDLSGGINSRLFDPAD